MVGSGQSRIGQNGIGPKQAFKAGQSRVQSGNTKNEQEMLCEVIITSLVFKTETKLSPINYRCVVVVVVVVVVCWVLCGGVVVLCGGGCVCGWVGKLPLLSLSLLEFQAETKLQTLPFKVKVGVPVEF